MVIWKRQLTSFVKKVYQAAAKKADRIAAEGTTYIIVKVTKQ